MAQASKEKLLEKKRAIDARLRQMAARDSELARKADTRRKVVAGAILLEHAQHDPAFKALVEPLLDQFVLARDRELFGLAPLAITAAAPATATVLEMRPPVSVELAATVQTDTPAAGQEMREAGAA